MKSADIQSETSKLKQAIFHEEKILIVDDNDINRKMLCTYLKALGHETLPASNGQHALELLETHPINLIFMDLRMPVMNGYETTRLIRGSKHPYKDIPIIGLSADGLAESLKNALEAGMNEYLIKPVKRDDLEQLLQKWLPIPPPVEPRYEKKTSRPLSIGELRQMMSDQLPGYRQTLLEKLEADDFGAIYDIAHKIAGGSVYCELPKLESAAIALQNAARRTDPPAIRATAEALLRIIDQTLADLR